MKERPILFKPDMVAAIRHKRKFQTRRVIKGIPEDCVSIKPTDLTGVFYVDCRESECGDIACPHGKPGDRLWIREAWLPFDEDHVIDGKHWAYMADTAPGSDSDRCRKEFGYNWRPSIHMPREASRVLLEITEVRAQRLQEISEVDAIAEGLPVQMGDGTGPGPGYKWSGPGYFDFVSRGRFGAPTFHVATGRHGEYCSCRDGALLKLTPARCAYRVLWNSINEKRGHGWDTNPWVWAVTFRDITEASKAA